MRPPRVTIRSVASEAGVSITTVSNVLNGRHEQMGADTRERVLAAMKRLGYYPNHLAQSLVTRRTATIGLIMSTMTNSLYTPVTIGAEAACRAAGYGLLLANAGDQDAAREAVELVQPKLVDGLILFSSSYLEIEHDYLFRARHAGVPVVTINRRLPATYPLSSIAFDHQSGAHQATRHLLDLVLRHIAGQEETEVKTLNTALLVRETTNWVMGDGGAPDCRVPSTETDSPSPGARESGACSPLPM